MRTLMFFAGLLLVAGCSPSNITHTLHADEETIELRQTGFWFDPADEEAEDHCADYDKKAVRVAAGGYKITYRCADTAEEEGGDS